jgi:hypothetical protein
MAQTCEPPKFQAVVPVKTTNPLNGSWGHWTAKSRARKAQRGGTVEALRTAFLTSTYEVKFPVQVHLVRVAPSNGLDDDALPAALKSIRDGVADWLGLDDDRTPLVRWTYDQRRGMRGQYQVDVTITRLEK